MKEHSMSDKTFNIIMKRMVESGQAPHYTEIAAELGLSMEEGRKALHDLFSAGVSGWLFPDTDFITSFAPFNHLPTQYRITIDGQQKWFGQWGFESLAVSWLYPGKTVRVDFPCLDCGLPNQVEMRDGVVLKAEPEGIVGYVAVPFVKWGGRLPHAWSTMNLFRSEEHVHNLAGFDPATEEGIISLPDLVDLFSVNHFTKRLDPDYFSSGLYMDSFLEAVTQLGKKRPFWSP